MSNKILRCAIYIRVSTAEQSMHGKSLQSQKEFLENYANSNGMVVVGVYADEGKTARKELKKRKAIHALIKDVESDKIDVIIFWKMDRWFRNVSDFYKVQDILDAHHVKWIATAEPNMNMDTRDGRLNLNIMLSIGQNEVDTTSERIRFTADNMVKNGRLIFGEENMPLGYKIGMKSGKKCMVKDTEAEDMVIEFFKYFRKHQAKRQTMLHMQNTFGINFSYTMLRTMLSSEFYKGTYRGVPYCPPYLTEQEWDDIQRISKKNVRTNQSSRIYLFTGMLKCPYCGSKLCGCGYKSIINRKTKEKKEYIYYRCYKGKIEKICKNNHLLSQNIIEKYLLENVENELKRFMLKCNTVQEGHILKKSNNVSNLKKELNNLNILFQKERITWNYYDKEYLRIQAEIEDIETVKKDVKRDLSKIESLLGNDFKHTYEKYNQAEKQLFWRNIIDEIIINEDYEVTDIMFL